MTFGIVAFTWNDVATISVCTSFKKSGHDYLRVFTCNKNFLHSALSTNISRDGFVSVGLVGRNAGGRAWPRRVDCGRLAAVPLQHATAAAGALCVWLTESRCRCAQRITQIIIGLMFQVDNTNYIRVLRGLRFCLYSGRVRQGIQHRFCRGCMLHSILFLFWPFC